MKSQRTTNSFIKGIDRDTSVNKYSNTTFYDAMNMRIITDNPLTAGAMTNVPGNRLIISLAQSDVIIGTCPIRNSYNDTKKDSILFFAVNTTSGYDSIYLLEGDADRIDTSTTPIDLDQRYAIEGTGPTAYGCGYIYRGTDLNLSRDYKVKAESRYESANIRKIYWVDGLNPIRYMILDNAIDLALAGTPITTSEGFEFNPLASLSAPSTSLVSGGGYTSGLVQHAYQLYVKNGARTAWSPTSNVLSLSSSNFLTDTLSVTGNELNKNTGNSVRINMTNLDSTYDRLRLVAIHYTQQNVSPTVYIVGEYNYDSSSGTLSIIDTGLTYYGTIPIDEFRIQGQINYVADSLASKNNIMFYANIKEDVWNPDWLDPEDVDFWDARAVRFRNFTDSVSSTDYSYATINDYDPDTGDVAAAWSNTNQISISISNFSSWAGVSSGRTVVDVTDILLDTIDVEYTIGDNTFNSSNMISANTDIVYNSGTDTLTFKINSIGFIFTNMPDTIDWVGAYMAIGYDETFEYSYTSSGGTVIEARVSDSSYGEITIDQPASDTPAEWNNAGWDVYNYDNDGVNHFNNTDNDGTASYEYKFKRDGLTIGAEGPYVEIDFDVEEFKIDTYGSDYYGRLESPYSGTGFDTSYRSSQRDEVYRMFIVFYNNKMQYTNPQWIADIRMPNINDDSGTYLTLSTDDTTYVNARYLFPKVSLKSLPSDSDLLGWQIYRCERGSIDRSILAKGIVSATYNDVSDSNKARPYSETSAMFIRAEDGAVSQHKILLEFVSPEINFNRNLVYQSGDRIRLDGRYTGVLSGVNNGRYLKITADGARDVSDSIYTGLHSAYIENTQTVATADLQEKVYNAITYRHITQYTSTNTYYGQKGTTLIARTDGDELTLDNSTNGYGNGSYVRNVFYTQYNGNTYEARSYNKIIPYSEFVLVSATPDEAVCRYGDTFISYFAYLRTMWPTAITTSYPTKELLLLPTETSINCFYRLDPIQQYTAAGQLIGTGGSFYIQEKEIDGVSEWPSNYPYDLGDLYRYNPVYSISPNANTIQCKTFDSLVIEENPVKIIATDKKINNEYFDSWTNIKVNNTLELEGKYGSINNVLNFGNRFFAFQDKAVSLISINERSLIQDANKLALTLGTGDVLARYDYLTTSSGIQESTDVIVSNKAIYYIDRSDKIIYNLTTDGDNPISEVLGLRSLLKSYGTITEVRTGFDPQFKEILFYIYDGTNQNTIVLNEYTNAFISKYRFYPELMYNVNDHFYSINVTPSSTDARAWRHNVGNYGQFYGSTDSEIYDSYVELIINPNEEIVDKYDTIDLRLDVIDEDGDNVLYGTVATIVASNNYQSITKTITFSDSTSVATALSETTKNLIRKWRVWLLPDSASTDFYRLTDTYLRLKITRDNSLVSITKTTPPGAENHSCRFTLHDITTYYRPTRN